MPQHLAAAVADRGAQHPHGCRGIEGINRREIVPVKPAVRFNAAPGQQQVGDAGGPSRLELHLDAKIIIPFQKRSVNDVEDIPAVVVPVIIHQPARQVRKLLGKVRVADAVSFFEHLRHRLAELIGHPPLVGVQGVSAGAGVRYVKDVSQALAVIVQQGDALGAAPDIAVHAVIPDVVLSAGRGVGALCVDHELVGVRVFV